MNCLDKIKALRRLIFIFALCSESLFGMGLEYVQSAIFPENKTQFEGTRVGGLSSLTQKDNLYWAVSDDKGQYGEPRLYGFQVDWTGKQLLISIQKVLRLSGRKEAILKPKALDFEGSVWSGESWILASEGAYHLRPKEMPSLMSFDADGGLQGYLNFSQDYFPNKTGPLKMGMRNNGAFEGLSLSPSGETLWVATEQPLLQDQPEWLQGSPAGLRVLRFQKKGNGLNREPAKSAEGARQSKVPRDKADNNKSERRVVRRDSAKGTPKGKLSSTPTNESKPNSEGADKPSVNPLAPSGPILDEWELTGEWTYPLSPVLGPNGQLMPFILGHGCSEILAISDDEVLFLERAAFPSRTGVDYQLQIYGAKITEPSKGTRPLLEKSLVFDFETIKDKMIDKKGLDNLEGMSFGPMIDSHQSILLVSDNNFNEIQRNLWVLLKIVKP